MFYLNFLCKIALSSEVNCLVASLQKQWSQCIVMTHVIRGARHQSKQLQSKTAFAVPSAAAKFQDQFLLSVMTSNKQDVVINFKPKQSVWYNLQYCNHGYCT